MPRKTELPKINMVIVSYNGNKKQFDRFMESLIYKYLDSDSVPNIEDETSVQKLEIIDKTA